MFESAEKFVVQYFELTMESVQSINNLIIMNIYYSFL